MPDEQVGCARPTGKVLGDEAPSESVAEGKPKTGAAVMAMVKVGGKAPDFEAPAYHRGKFINVKLSDYLGKWVLLCFYPGDFTFV